MYILRFGDQRICLLPIYTISVAQTTQRFAAYSLTPFQFIEALQPYWLDVLTLPDLSYRSSKTHLFLPLFLKQPGDIFVFQPAVRHAPEPLSPHPLNPEPEFLLHPE